MISACQNPAQDETPPRQATMASDDWTTQNTPSGSNNINEGSLEAMDSFSIHDHNDSDSDSVSDMTSSEDGDLDDYPLNERLQIPTEYFKRLDSLESQVLENSMIQFYTVTLP